jgi:hypothetical protein
MSPKCVICKSDSDVRRCTECRAFVCSPFLHDCFDIHFQERHVARGEVSDTQTEP